MPNNLRHYLDVIIVLAQKDFKIRYKNSVLGFLWSLLNPLAYMVILTLVFSFLLRIAIQNYAAWMLIGLLIWRFFAIGTSLSLGSIMGNPSLVSKVYLPRFIIVLSSNVANLLGAALEFIALLPVIFILGVSLTPYLLLLPAILSLEFLLIFGLSLSLSSLNLKYRDFDQIWNIALQLGFFLSPIVYDASLIPRRYQLLYSLNPVTRLIESTRDILLRSEFPSFLDSAVILSGIVFFLVLGAIIFKSLEGRFAEEL